MSASKTTFVGGSMQHTHSAKVMLTQVIIAQFIALHNRIAANDRENPGNLDP